MNKYLFLTLSLAISTLSWAQDDECLKKLQGLLKNPSEKYLFAKRSHALNYFPIDCKETEMGTPLINADAVVFVHEAAHFEDLQFDKDMPEEEMGIHNFNLYTAQGEHIGNLEKTEELPSIKSLVRPFLKSQKPDFLEEDSIFFDHHETYIGAEDSMAAKNLQGMATELSAYTHGTVIQHRLQSLISATLTLKDELGNDHTIENPYKGKITQAEGVYYFIYNLNLYFNLLKEKHPEKWNNFFTEKNKVFIQKLLKTALLTLKDINHCEIKNSDERIAFYMDELKGENLEIIEEILGEDDLQNLTCSSPAEDLKDILKAKPACE